jgi:hypothetical protein
MWIHIPRLTSVSLAESEVSTSPSGWLPQTLAASAMWRQKFLQPRIWSLVLKRNPFVTRLFGRTSEPSTANHGADLWMESLRASRAPTTPSPASAPGSSASTANSGTTFTAALMRFDPNGSIWRTCPELLYPTRFDVGDGILTSESGRLTHCLPDSGLFLGTWPRSGSMRSGVVYQRPRLALRTSAKGGSVWPTARAEDSECCGNHPDAQDSLGGATRSWSTPSTEDHKSDGPAALSRYGTDEMRTCDERLRNQAMTWITPHGMNGMDATGKVGAGGEFAKQVTKWKPDE